MSYFGEVMDSGSRAVWENYDNDAIECPLLIWSKENTLPDTEYNLLLVIEGSSAVEYVESCLIISEPINNIEGVKVSIYKDPCSSTIICTSLNDNDSIAADISQMLQPWITLAKNVIVIQSLSFTQYQSHDKPESSCIIRTLHSHVACKPTDTPLLEQPNIVNGLAAGVISLCEHLDRPGSVFLFYMDSPLLALDSTNTRPFTDMYRRLQIPCHKSFTPRLKTPSNLYM